MNSDDMKLQRLAGLFVTDRDAYDGISYESPPINPNNILVFTRTALRDQDYKNTGHHRYVLVFFIKNPGSLFVDRHHYHPQDGQIVLIRPFQHHHYAPPPDTILWLFISFVLPETQEIKPFDLPAAMTGFITGLLEKLLEAYHAGLTQETAGLLACILYELGAGSRSALSDLSPERKLLAEINSYIHEHLGEPFTLQDIGKHCSLSASYLSMRFKKSMGISLGNYIHNVRLNHAMTLLARTNLTVSEIAYRSGFSSPAIFCRAFKKETGKSALNFRRQSRRLSSDNP